MTVTGAPHAHGTECGGDGAFRGLCWCKWRGEWRDSARSARRDAVEHCREFRVAREAA